MLQRLRGMLTALVDIHEPLEISAGLQKYQIIVGRQNLVPKGFADIYWIGYNNITYTLERKTASQVVSEMGYRLDEQLTKHTHHVNEVGLIIEGFATPLDKGGTQFWAKSQDEDYFYKTRTSPIGYEAYSAYLWRLDKQGISVYQYADLNSLCLGVASIISNTNKEEHRGLGNYRKSKKIQRDITPQEQLLMSLPGVGPKIAKAILDQYSTPFNFFEAGVPVKGMSQAKYEEIMKMVGRL